jgi:hypothetical protein
VKIDRDYDNYVDEEVSSIQWEETIKLQEMFEDSALQDATAYAMKINRNINNFKDKGRTK